MTVDFWSERTDYFQVACNGEVLINRSLDSDHRVDDDGSLTSSLGVLRHSWLKG